MLRDASQQADTGAAAVASGAYQPGNPDDSAALAPGDDTQQQQDSAAAPAEAPTSQNPVDPGQGLDPNRLEGAALQPALLVPASC